MLPIQALRANWTAHLQSLSRRAQQIEAETKANANLASRGIVLRGDAMGRVLTLLDRWNRAFKSSQLQGLLLFATGSSPNRTWRYRLLGDDALNLIDSLPETAQFKLDEEHVS